jgi:hypothetical protein
VSSLLCETFIASSQQSRRERDWVLGEFKAGHSPILIATDVASRGLGMCFLTVASASTLRRDTMGNKQLASGLAWPLCHFVVLVRWYDDGVR